MTISRRARLLATGTILSACAGFGLFVDTAAAQASAEPKAAEALEEVVVTGSRIRRSAATDTAAPVSIVDTQDMQDRGFVAAGQILNTITSIAPSIPQSAGNAATLRQGATYPNLFNLGSGRTLTLVDGQRMVTTAAGVGDRVVDTNTIPVGLIERVDVVQAGGAAVYGSDAIAGVVNYVLRKNFNGLEVDAQTGISSRDDYPQHSLRVTAGRNFLEGRGNFAVNLEWSKNDPLMNRDRPETNPYQINTSNPADRGPTDGLPSVIRITDARFYAFNPNGVIFTIPAPVPIPPCGNQICFLRSGATPLQFSPDGQSIIPYNPGTIIGVPFAQGGEGTSFGDLAALYVGVERYSLGTVGRYDLSDHLKLSGSVLYTQVKSSDPLGSGQGGVTKTILNQAATGAGPVIFTRNNPFLTAAQVTALSAASPAFAAGAPLFLSKQYSDLLPSNASTVTTDTFRAALTLDGDFTLAGRAFYYSVGFSHGEAKGKTSFFGVYNTRFNNAINAVRNAQGQIVCAINADASSANDDAACAPINPFGDGNISDAAAQYASIEAGSEYINMQDDFLLTLGGDLITLPGGTTKFSLGYEHRNEAAKFKPSIATQLALAGQTAVVPTRGEFNTDELSAEILVPVVGGDFTLPFVKAFEVTGQYRRVSNSIAGKENVWGLGARWDVVEGVTLRVSRSRNFRAPTLDQLFAPQSTALGGILVDPCDARFIDAGPAPAVRRANCEALFRANPGYNGGRGLAGYNDPNTNLAGTLITTGGNANLDNEVADTTTFGFVLQPRFLPGLTITADRLEVDILNGLTPFEPRHFAQACFDVSPQQPDVCSTFTRNANGDIATALNTTFNAAKVRYRGETYNVTYRFALGDLAGGADWGDMELGVQATHNEELTTVVAGALTQAAGTIQAPRWVARFDARWKKGPMRLSYEANYLSKTMRDRTDTIESFFAPRIDDNLRHSISGAYAFGDYEVRAGVNNVTDQRPSYPTTSYGDIIGRFFFVGLKASF